MKKFNILFLFGFFIFFDSSLIAVETIKVENTLKNKYADVQKVKRVKSKNIEFNFKDVDLIDVINIVAEVRGENIILPTGADVIKAKVTVDIPGKLTIDESWDMLNTILDAAGYVIKLSAGGMRQVRKKDDNTFKGPYRIFKEDAQAKVFVGEYENIPEVGNERITFIGYFENIQVPKEAGSEGDNVVQRVLQMFMGSSVNSTSDSGTSGFRFLPDSNGIIIVDKASNVRSMMKVFKELDKAEFKECLEIVRLEHVSADKVVEMFTNDQSGIIKKKAKATYRLGKKRKTQSNYFDKETKIVSEQKSNSIILLGRRDSVDRIKEFIFRFIDIPIDGGRSVLHRKKLDYLNANSIRDVLLKVIGSGGDSDTQAKGGTAGSGPERFFTEGIKITTDKPNVSEGDSSAKYKYAGTNSLLVAAKGEDWVKINELIEKLDKPVKQAIIEILIVDLQMNGNRALGSQMRNPALAPLFDISQNGGPINMQSAQLAGVQTTACGPTASTIHADLMQGTQTDSTKTSYNPFVGGATAGTAMLTLSDPNGSTWSVLKLLDLYENKKILSHPYIVARNNKEAYVELGETRVVQGSEAVNTGGGTTVKKYDLTASTKVKVTPRIGGIDNSGNQVINMQVDIDISDFELPYDFKDINGTGSNPQIRRNIVTNANIKSGEILVLGGLIKVEDGESQRQTPILGRIPLIGWLFKSRSSGKVKNNLTVFIRVTAIEPELINRMNSYTKDYINVAKTCSSEGGLFEGLRDPVTRWFFGTGDETDRRIDNFTKIQEKVIQTEELKFGTLNNGLDESSKKSAYVDNNKKDDQKIMNTQAYELFEENIKQNNLTVASAYKNSISSSKSNRSSGARIKEKAAKKDLEELDFGANGQQLQEKLQVMVEPKSETEILLASAAKNGVSGNNLKTYGANLNPVDDKLKEMLHGVENPFC